MPEQGSKARRLLLRVAESTLDKTLEHEPKIVSQPTGSPCIPHGIPFGPQVCFKVIEVSVSGVSDFFAQQLGRAPEGDRLRFDRLLAENPLALLEAPKTKKMSDEQQGLHARSVRQHAAVVTSSTRSPHNFAYDLPRDRTESVLYVFERFSTASSDGSGLSTGNFTVTAVPSPGLL